MTENQITDSIWLHVAKAKEKHPLFCNGLATREMTLEKVQETLEISRGLEPTAINILNEEVYEILEAYLQGKKKEAVEECFDAIAVLARIIEQIERDL